MPSPVKQNLPDHAQEIYQKAFNAAYDEYKKKSSRRDPEDSREEAAHKVAWAAVKKECHKEGDRWVKDA